MDGDDDSRMAAGEQQPYYTDPPVPRFSLLDIPAYHLSTSLLMMDTVERYYSTLARQAITRQPSTDAIDEGDTGMDTIGEDGGHGAVSGESTAGLAEADDVGETSEMNQELGYSGDSRVMQERAPEEATQHGGMDMIDEGDEYIPPSYDHSDVVTRLRRRRLELQSIMYLQELYLSGHGQTVGDGRTIGEDDAYRNGGFGAIPASSGAIAGLAEMTVGEAREKRCGVCMEDFGSEDKLRKMPCSHGFHESCITTWLRVSRVCPYCRFPLSAAEQ